MRFLLPQLSLLLSIELRASYSFAVTSRSSSSSSVGTTARFFSRASPSRTNNHHHNNNHNLLVHSAQHEETEMMVSTGGSSSSSSTLPKEETDVLALLEKYPQADGRGIKVAIMDTGCDLKAAGMSETSDGQPKYLDFIDCTGDGDIDMNKTVATSNDEGKSDTVDVVGLTGRKLILGEWAKNITEMRTGAVPLFHLLPDRVKGRIKGERKKLFMAKHQETISKTQQALDNEADKKNSKELEVLLEQLKETMESYSDPGPVMDILMFQDDKDTWKAVIDLQANGDLSEAVPMAPFAAQGQVGELGFGSAVSFCVQVYDEGNILSIVTDAGTHGTHVAGITAAYFQGEDGDKLNGVAPGAQILALKIGDGRLGSAETGTGLVRALVAAKKYGCSLINLSYGEPSWRPNAGRVSQTFTDAVYKWGMTVFTSAGNDGPALSSLGSPGALSAPITVGAYVSQSMMEDQYATLPPAEDEPPLIEGAPYYFSSRGPTPDGAFPDLCAPGGAIAPVTRSALQKKSQYHGTSMSSPNACGVAACVLSALKLEGITSVNPTELRRGLVTTAKQVGIADPFAKGRGLISATHAVDYIVQHHGKQGQDLAFDVSIPTRSYARGIYIRDEMELRGPTTYGVLVEPRFEHASERTSEEVDELLSLELELELKPSDSWVVCPKRMTLLSGKDRGQSFNVRLNHKDLPPGVHFATVDAVDPSDPGRGALFQVPITVVIPHFYPRLSKQSEDETSEEQKMAPNSEDIVTKSNGIDVSMRYQLDAGVPVRRFLVVPPTAEWATFTVRSDSPIPSGTSQNAIYYLHAVPFVRGDIPNTEVQMKKAVRINEGVEKKFVMVVKGGATLELCLQLLWLADSSPASVVVDVEFHSLGVAAPTLGVHSQPLTITASKGFARLGTSAALRSETLNPSATLKTVEQTIVPKKYNITAGEVERDILPPSDAEIAAAKQRGTPLPIGTHIYDMHLQYEFKIEGGGETKEDPISVTPCVTSLFHQLYDSPLDSLLWVLKDSSSKVLGYGGSIHQADAVSLKKGDYTITLHLRHPDRNVLEKMKDVPLRLSLALPSALECSIYTRLDKASTPDITGDGRVALTSEMMLRRGDHKDLYITRPTGKFPAWVTPGDVVTGSVVLDKGNKAGTEMELAYVFPPKPSAEKESKSDDKDDEEDTDEEESLTRAIFDAKLEYLKKLRASKKQKEDEKYTEYRELAAELKKENATSIPLLQEFLVFAKESSPPASEADAESEWRAKEIATAVDAMMKENGGPLDGVEIAQYFGCNPPSEDELKEDKAAKKQKKDMEEQRKVLRAALLDKASALGKLLVETPPPVNATDASTEKAEEIQNTTDTAATTTDDSAADNSNSEFDDTVKLLKKWVSGPGDLSEDKEKVAFDIVLARQARFCQNKKATAISILLKARKKRQNGLYKEITNELISTYESMEGLDHVVENLKNSLLESFPVTKQKMF